jgi:ribosomal protein L40E
MVRLGGLLGIIVGLSVVILGATIFLRTYLRIDFVPLVLIFMGIASLFVAYDHSHKKKTQKTADSGLICWKCGTQLDMSATYCWSCGAQAKAGGSKVCSNCGHENPRTNKFCGECARPLGDETRIY